MRPGAWSRSATCGGVRPGPRRQPQKRPARPRRVERRRRLGDRPARAPGRRPERWSPSTALPWPHRRPARWPASPRPAPPRPCRSRSPPGTPSRPPRSMRHARFAAGRPAHGRDGAGAGGPPTPTVARRASSPRSCHELANPLTPVLALGAGLSAAVGSATDAALVGGVVVANAAVSGGQRVRTELSIATPLRMQRGHRLRHGATERLSSWRRPTSFGGDVDRPRVGRRRAGRLPHPRRRRLRGRRVESHRGVASGAASGRPPPRAPTVAERTCMLYEGHDRGGRAAPSAVVVADRRRHRGRAGPGRGTRAAAERRRGPPGRAHPRSPSPSRWSGGAAVTGIGLLRRRPLRDAVGTGGQPHGRGGARRACPCWPPWPS